MTDQNIYLELSKGDSHKFYELKVVGSTLAVRFGRIGDAGQTQTERHGSPDKAWAEAQAKAKKKRAKGYAPAVIGKRKKKPIARRPIESKASSAKAAPILWKFKTGAATFGIHIDSERCWAGNEQGSVYALDHQGKVQQQFRLPEGVKCLVADEQWRYAGCDDGKVYDLTGRTPREAYELAPDVEVLWLDIAYANLCVSDQEGNVAVVDHEGDPQWKKKASGNYGWMVRGDRRGVYQGHDGGVTAWSWNAGKTLWKSKVKGCVWFGWQADETVYACTTAQEVHTFDKLKGKLLATAKCDDGVYSCAASPDGKRVFAADTSSSIYCFDEKGKRQWKLGLDCGSALSMQYQGDKLYVVTNEGYLACIDASDAAVTAAEKDQRPKVRAIAAPKPVAAVASNRLETAKSAKGLVELVCVDDKGKLRMKVASPGYQAGWYVQFPRNLREKGARYVVDEIREASRGQFYRVLGEIKKLGGR